MPDGPAYPSTGVDGAAWVGLIYDKPAAGSAHGVISGGDERESGGKHMMFARAVKNFLPPTLDELAHPPADVVADDRDTDTDDEHVEAGAEGSAAGEDGSGGTDQEM